jgi:predicted RNA-binding protein YlxR (DUF448 family)
MCETCEECARAPSYRGYHGVYTKLLGESMTKKIPLRQCIGCGAMKSKKEMLRILKTQEGAICLDATGKKNGRGAYLCKQEECLRRMRKVKGLERSFHMCIPEQVYDALEEEFEKLEAK